MGDNGASVELLIRVPILKAVAWVLVPIGAKPTIRSGYCSRGAQVPNLGDDQSLKWVKSHRKRLERPVMVTCEMVLTRS
jgi:hypothetical protein